MSQPPAMEELPLFPLSSVLLPYGRMPLQIFEQRYLDLIRDCMKTNTGFGVVWIRSGSEISGPGRAVPTLGDYGTLAHIVDWDQLPNGLLGISIEGKETFRLDGTHSVESGLVVGQVVLNGAVQSEPLLEKWRVLERVLRSLEKHPHVQRMNLTIDFNHAWQVGYSLVQLLPLEESVKYELLGAKSLDNLMAGLDSILNQISPDA
jgi:uncharacterized protein